MCVGAGASGLPGVPAHADAGDIGRDALSANDGRASEGTGITGGSAVAADPAYGGHLSRADHATDGYDGDTYLATHDPRAWGSAAGRTPTLHAKIDNADAAHRPVARGAGAGRLP
ncbi:hypothetical protein SAMN06272735_2011 [Streptomyces sp. TLI_55]|nr:hypothetical protein SAMN06272735_2011 [Streptomyces sp. TLI_55]